jgi:hypothetical protein
MAVGTVRDAVTAPMIMARSIPNADNCTRDMPSARRVGNSADSK